MCADACQRSPIGRSLCYPTIIYSFIIVGHAVLALLASVHAHGPSTDLCFRMPEKPGRWLVYSVMPTSSSPISRPIADSQCRDRGRGRRSDS